ncbi:Hypothetical protein Y17_1237 [Pectobacterium wasabiae CFBP 3304]|nr:Hypothetical protein Y17_1237 [Pectobacterium wasabiae CFBP 3304]
MSKAGHGNTSQENNADRLSIEIHEPATGVRPPAGTSSVFPLIAGLSDQH